MDRLRSTGIQSASMTLSSFFVKGKDYTFNADAVREPYNQSTIILLSHHVRRALESA